MSSQGLPPAFFVVFGLAQSCFNPPSTTFSQSGRSILIDTGVVMVGAAEPVSKPDLELESVTVDHFVRS